MAKTVRKPRKKAAKKKAKTKVVRKKVARRGVPVKEMCTTELQMNGSRLVVQLSREDHPEVFALDHLVKEMQRVTKAYRRRRKMRDVVEFLDETERSLQILLKNHLEDAMRVYFK